MSRDLVIQVKPEMLPCECPKGMTRHAMNCPVSPNELQMPPTPPNIQAYIDLRNAANEFANQVVLAFKPALLKMIRLAEQIKLDYRPVTWRRTWKNGKPK